LSQVNSLENNKEIFMSFDIKKNDPTKLAEAGHTFKIETPDGEVQDATVTVRGTNSPKVKDFLRTSHNQWRMRDAQAKKRGKEPEDLTIDELEDFGIRSAVVRIIGWKGIEEDGKVIVFSPEEAVRLMTEHAFLRDAVVKESDNALNFRSK
jgi:hypothetical protein